MTELRDLPLDRHVFDAAALMAEHPPRVHNANKQVVLDIGCPPGAVHRGTIGYTRWSAMQLPEHLGPMPADLVVAAGSAATPMRRTSSSNGPSTNQDCDSGARQDPERALDDGSPHGKREAGQGRRGRVGAARGLTPDTTKPAMSGIS